MEERASSKGFKWIEKRMCRVIRFATFKGIKRQGNYFKKQSRATLIRKQIWFHVPSEFRVDKGFPEDRPEATYF